MSFETIEYSVCGDCLLEHANGDTGHDIAPHIARELNGKTGHLSMGVEPTEDDPTGAGECDFSWGACELCRCRLGGSRHGMTLFIKTEGVTP